MTHPLLLFATDVEYLYYHHSTEPPTPVVVFSIRRYGERSATEIEMPTLPFLRPSLDRDRDPSRERLPVSPPANGPMRIQQQQAGPSTTPTRSFSDRLLRRRPSISKNGTPPSAAPPVPPLSAGLSEYETSSEPRTASTMGDVFAEQQSARSETFEITPIGHFTPRLPDSHPFDPRNQVRPPTPSSSKSGHAYVVPSIPSVNDARATPPPHRAPTSPTPTRNTPTPEGRINGSMAEWLTRQPSRGKLRSSSHGSATRPPLDAPLPPLRHKSPRPRAPDRMGDLRELSSTDESHSGEEVDGQYEVSVACTESSGEMKWEITVRPRQSTTGVSAHSHTLTPSLGKSTIIAPLSASSMNLSLALNQPTGKLVFIQFPSDVSTPSRRRKGVSPAFAAHSRTSTFGSTGTPSRSDSPARLPVLGAPLPDDPSSPPSLVRPETPPPRMKTPPPLPATPLSDVRTPRRHNRSSSRNLGQSSTPARTLQYSPPSTPSRDPEDRVGISTTLNGELVGSPRGTTPRRHRIVSASQLNGGLYAPGTVDGLSEDLESELVLGGELRPPPSEERQRTFGGRI